MLGDGSRWQVSDAVARLLTDAGVSRAVIGHTPVGNCPSVIRTPLSSSTEVANPLAAEEGGEGSGTAEGLTVFNCDTSYSNIARVPGGGARGKAVSEVIIESDARTTVHGALETGDAIRYTLDGLNGGDSHVGRDLGHPPPEQGGAAAGRRASVTNNTVFVAARLAKATRSKAYLLQRPGRFTQEQWLVGAAAVEDAPAGGHGGGAAGAGKEEEEGGGAAPKRARKGSGGLGCCAMS